MRESGAGLHTSVSFLKQRDNSDKCEEAEKESMLLIQQITLLIEITKHCAFLRIRTQV